MDTELVEIIKDLASKLRSIRYRGNLAAQSARLLSIDFADSGVIDAILDRADKVIISRAQHTNDAMLEAYTCGFEHGLAKGVELERIPTTTRVSFDAVRIGDYVVGNGTRFTVTSNSDGEYGIFLEETPTIWGISWLPLRKCVQLGFTFEGKP